MKKIIVLFEYNSEVFMDLDKILIFKNNLEKIEKMNNEINLVFYGEAPNEEFSTFMGFFNSLLQKDICKISISFKTKELVIENGINNKSIKLSAKNSKEIKNKQFENVIKDYYCNNDLQVMVLPIKDWENIILDLIGE